MSSDYYARDYFRKYDRAILEQVESIVQGRGDGRLSEADCEPLFHVIADRNLYTDVEKATIRHVRRNYKFTPTADEKLRHMVASWAAKRGWETRRQRGSRD